MSKLSVVVAQDIGSRFGFDEVLIIGRKHAAEENVIVISWGRTDKYRSWAEQLAYYFQHKLQQWHIAGMDRTLDNNMAKQVAPPRGAAS